MRRPLSLDDTTVSASAMLTGSIMAPARPAGRAKPVMFVFRHRAPRAPHPSQGARRRGLTRWPRQRHGRQGNDYGEVAWDGPGSVRSGWQEVCGQDYMMVEWIGLRDLGCSRAADGHCIQALWRATQD